MAYLQPTFTLSDHPVLLVVDMQNGFVHPNGTFGKLGLNVWPHKLPIAHISRLINLFEDRSLPIIFFRLSFADESYEDAGILLDRTPQVKKMKGFLRGTWDAEIVDELKPAASQLGGGNEKNSTTLVIDKTRNSPFFRTELDETLKGLGANQLIVTGVGTNVCVEATVRDAFTYGHKAVVVSEATATLDEDVHRASLKNMGDWFGEVRSVAEVTNAFGT